MEFQEYTICGVQSTPVTRFTMLTFPADSPGVLCFLSSPLVSLAPHCRSLHLSVYCSTAGFDWKAMVSYKRDTPLDIMSIARPQLVRRSRLMMSAHASRHD